MRRLAYDYVRQGEALVGLAPARAALVGVIIVCQSAEVTESLGAFAASPFWLLPQIAWCGLFVLLGFTWQASRARHEIKRFARDRLLRAAPVYALAVLLAMLMLGPLVATSSIANYFRDGESWAYLLNLIAYPRLTLPGTFEFNVLSETVNTVVLFAPAAVIVATAVALAPLAPRWREWALPAVLIVFALLAVAFWAADLIPPDRGSFVRNLFTGAATAPTIAGLTGAIAWQSRERIPIDRRVGAAVLALVAAMMLLGGPGLLESPLFALLLAFAVAYATLQFAVRRRPAERIAARLQPLFYPALCFSFPIQQSAAITDFGSANAALNFLAAAPAIAVAVVAWRLLDTRVLARFLPAARTLAKPVAPAPVKRRKRDFVERARVAGWFVLVGVIMIAVLTALMALTGYALQRPAEGM